MGLLILTPLGVILVLIFVAFCVISFGFWCFDVCFFVCFDFGVFDVFVCWVFVYGLFISCVACVVGGWFVL